MADMKMNRRSFLRGALSVVAATSVIVPVTRSLVPIPCIWGDGAHDDAPGLSALFSGKPVDILNDVVRVIKGDRPQLNGGLFLLRSTVVIRRSGFEIVDAHFEAEFPDGFNGPMLHVLGDGNFESPGCPTARIERCHLIVRPSSNAPSAWLDFRRVT